MQNRNWLGAAKMEQMTITAAQRIHAPKRLRLRPTRSEMKPAAELEMIAAKLFHVCSDTASEGKWNSLDWKSLLGEACCGKVTMTSF